MADYVVNVENIPRSLELESGPGGLRLVYIDQRLLPAQLKRCATGDWHEVVSAIGNLAVRGAPAIGLAGAAALALWLARRAEDARGDEVLAELDAVCSQIVEVRPTAVNLRWAVERASGVARQALEAHEPPLSALGALVAQVKAMEAEDERVNRAIGDNGAALLAGPSKVLTHCNAGSLATAFYGTALGVIYSAAKAGKVKMVYADETRPVGQGARLTAWELARAGVPVTLICDDMAASLMAAGEVDCVIVGADRIAANGDTANKIGTYGVAILAHEHGIPFYVAAPSSTLDLTLADGSGIVIEQRAAAEVLPNPIEGVRVWNPAFDVTPARYIAKIITERGVFSPRELASGNAPLPPS